jgi:hypothetical protein
MLFGAVRHLDLKFGNLLRLFVLDLKQPYNPGQSDG